MFSKKTEKFQTRGKIERCTNAYITPIIEKVRLVLILLLLLISHNLCLYHKAELHKFQIKKKIKNSLYVR